MFMTAPWHAARTACKLSWAAHLPRYVLENGQLALKGDCYEGLNRWLRAWLENAASYRWFIEPYRNEISHDDVDLYIRILVAAVNLAREKYHAATLIPYIANHWYLKGTGFSDDEIVQRFRDGGAMVVDVSLAKEFAAGAKLSIVGDEGAHPTPLANRLRASLLKDSIENRMPGILVAGVH